MTEKLVRIADNTTLLLLAFLTSASLLFPVFSNPGMTLVYKTCIVIAGLIFIMSNKLLKEEQKLETPIDGNLILLLAWYLVSSFYARNIFSAFNSAVTFTIFLLFFYIVYNYAKTHFTGFLFFIVAVAVLMCLYGLYQYYVGFDETLKYLAANNSSSLEAIKARLDSKRIFSTLIYPNTFAGFLILIIPAVIGLIKSEKKYRPYLIAALALFTINLFLTRSIGAFICLIVAAFLMLIFVTDQELKNFRRVYIGFVIISAGLLILVVKLRGLSAVLPEIGLKTESWIKMAAIISSRLFTGFGPGSFEQVYNDPAFGKSGFLKYAHNFIMQSGIETGVIGMGLLVLAGYSAYNSIIKNFYFIRTQDKKILVFSLLTGITAFLLHNLLDFEIYSFEITIVFLILLACLMSQMNIGLIQLKKLKLSYLLGINPGKRRSIIFYIILVILVLSAVTGGKQIYVLSLIYILVCTGFSMWSVSKEDIRRTNADVPLLLFTLWSGATLFITPNIYSGIKIYTLIVASAVVYYLSSQFLRRLDFRVTIANVIIVIGVMLGITAAGQFLYNYRSGLPLYADAFFPNPSLFSAYMCLPFAFLLSRLLFEKNMRMFTGKISMLVLITVAASLAYSKSGMLSILFAFVLISYYYHTHKDAVKDVPRQAAIKKWLIASLFTLIMILSFSPLTPSGEKMLNVSSDPFYFNRAEIYKSAASMGIARPFAGWGIGSFESIFPKFNFPIKAAARYQMETAFAHNEFLQLFAETGFPGAALLIWLLFTFIKRLPAYEGHKKLWAIKTGAYFSLAALLFHSLFYFTFHLPGIMLTAAVLASFVSEERFTIRTVSRESLLFTKIYYLPALLLSFIIFFLAIRPPAAHFLFDKYKHSGNYDLLYNAGLVDPLNSVYPYEKGLFYEKNGNLRQSIPFFESALKLDRKNYIYSLHSARAYAAIGDNIEALKRYKSAIAFSPYRAFGYSEIASFYFNHLNDAPDAEINLKKSIELEPNYIEAMNNLAVVYSFEKKYSGALAEYDRMELIYGTLKPITDYEKSIVSFPAYMIHSGKARIFMEKGNKNLSCAEYLKALSIDTVGAKNPELDSFCGKEINDKIK
jgi:tetratricopeptide (TPR) repeat protein